MRKPLNAPKGCNKKGTETLGTKQTLGERGHSPWRGFLWVYSPAGCCIQAQSTVKACGVGAGTLGWACGGGYMRNTPSGVCLLNQLWLFGKQSKWALQENTSYHVTHANRETRGNAGSKTIFHKHRFMKTDRHKSNNQTPWSGWCSV